MPSLPPGEVGALQALLLSVKEILGSEWMLPGSHRTRAPAQALRLRRSCQIANTAPSTMLLAAPLPPGTPRICSP